MLEIREGEERKYIDVVHSEIVRRRQEKTSAASSSYPSSTHTSSFDFNSEYYSFTSSLLPIANHIYIY